MSRNLVLLMVAWSVGACSVASPVHEEVQSEVQEAVLDRSTQTVLSPTPAMLEAARTGDPAAMANAVTPKSCTADFTCPPQYGACTGWSSGVWCDEVCLSTLCAEGLNGKDYFNSYRICFDSGQNPCTEWRTTWLPICGC